MVSRLLLAVTILAISVLPTCTLANPTNFETHQVRPMVLTADGNLLLVVNTPDHRLSIFDMQSGQPVLAREARTGLDPCSVNVNAAGDAWVTNHLSDDVTVIDVATGQVKASFRVGDEPADVVFVDHPILDDGSQWAVISISQEDRVVVHDAQPPYAQVVSLDIPGSDPRSLAVSPDGTQVFVAAFESGNKTIMAPREMVFDPANPWGGLPPPFDPPLNPDLPLTAFPFNGVMVRETNGQWLDEQGGNWTSMVNWGPMDHDVFTIDIGPAPSLGSIYDAVGTLLDEVAVDDQTGDVWIANIHSKNHILYEPKLNGQFAVNRVSVIRQGGLTAQAFRLNTHLDGVVPLPKAEILPIPHFQRENSLSSPNELVFATLGSGQRRLFVSSIGGTKVAVVNPQTGNVVDRLDVPEGGSGLVYHAASSTLVMLSRFDNHLHLVDPLTGYTGTSVGVGRSGWDPSLPEIKEGRRFLYTGSQSNNGALACALCHPYGNLDNIAWDLGDPSGEMAAAPPPGQNGGVQASDFHPLKGPMTSQTLRGLKDTEPFHWRGDREDFNAFNGAFASLLGGDELSPGDMQKYTDFILSICFPPNPHLNLDGSLSTDLNGGNAVIGEDIFINANDGFCVTCHALPTGTGSVIVPLLSFQFGNQSFKVAQTRNLYEKTGFDDPAGFNNKRVFGYLHDGSDNDLMTFLEEEIGNRVSEEDRPHVVAYLLSFPTETHPSVGLQVTLGPGDADVLDPDQHVATLVSMANAGNVDVIAHGMIEGEERGWLYNANGWISDRFGEIWPHQDLLDAPNVHGGPISYLGVPRGEGIRMGIDRDGDGAFDRDELDNGTDPADPTQTPTAVDGFDRARTAVAQVTSIFPAPFSARTTVEVYLSAATDVSVDVYDVRGRRVLNLASGRQTAGTHRFLWNGTDVRGQSVSSGVYFVRVKTPETAHQRKVLRIG